MLCQRTPEVCAGLLGAQWIDKPILTNVNGERGWIMSRLRSFQQSRSSPGWRGVAYVRRLHDSAIYSCADDGPLLSFSRYQHSYMRTVKYVGEPRNIGRFGDVVKGQELVLTEGEWDCVSLDPSYKLISGDVTDEAMRLAVGILPIGTPIFDLRTIPWENPNVFNRLTARASRNQLRGIIEAMRLAGAVVTEPNYDGEKLFVVDAIISASKNMRWDRYTEQQRMLMPRLEDDGNGNLVLRHQNPSQPYVPRVFTDIPTARFDKEGTELVESEFVVSEEAKQENSKKKLKTITAFRKRGKRQPAIA